VHAVRRSQPAVFSLAEQAHAGRLSRIDELADSFAEIEGIGRSIV
jgi:hypothetical protein